MFLLPPFLTPQVVENSIIATSCINQQPIVKTPSFPHLTSPTDHREKSIIAASCINQQPNVKTLLLLFLLWPCSSAFAQSDSLKDSAVNQNQELSNSVNHKDSLSLAYALKKGSKVSLHLRLYYMTTNNEKELSDYYAYAFGGGLKYQTGVYRGFQFTVGGFFLWNLASSDLTKPDPSTGIYNRYEVGQFDMEDFSKKNNIDRLEDFNLSYRLKKSIVTVGKQNINTPFINPQDGRMRPTGEQGLWLDVQDIPRTRIQAGWLNKISPRGTTRWLDMDQSIGIYSAGLNTDGKKSNYKGNLQSKGVALLGLTYQLKPTWTLQAWEYYTDNIFNSFLLQSDATFKLGSSSALIAGVQYTYQHAIRNGGNDSISKTYFDPKQTSNVLSGRLGFQVKGSRFLFNYTRITADGRFLFPREWGREPMYTFMKRERNEGLGDVNAFSFSFFREWQEKITMELGYGYYDLPGATRVALNKYAMPSYHQLLLDLNYSLDGFLKGLQLEFLYTYKLQAEEITTARLVINKVNMHHLNFIINYRL